MASLSLDDWRIVEAIASQGTTAGAARQLGLNQSTVFRRIAALEDALGARLFDRHHRGFALTLEGERLLPDIRRLTAMGRDVERKAAGLDHRSYGEVSLSVSTSVVRYLLADTLRQFHKAHPEIIVHLDLSDRLVNLREREADVVIRGSNEPSPDLFGRRLMRLHFAIYSGARGRTLSRHRRLFEDNPDQLPWILWRGALLTSTPGQWMKRNLGGVTPILTTTDVEASADVMADGMGCGLLPRFLGDRHPGTTRISDNIDGLHADLWVLTHEDLRRTTRISRLLGHISKALRQSNELPDGAA